MKLLDRYVLRELIVPFLIGSVTLLLMFQANTLIAFMKQYASQNVPTLAIIQLLLYKTPEFLKFTLPSTMALASSLAMSRLARESELTAMRSAGASIRRVVVPIGVFGAVIAVGNFLIVDRLQPIAETKFKEVVNKAVMLGTAPVFVQNIFFRAGRMNVFFGSAQRMQNGATMVRDVMLVEHMEAGKISIITAEEGTFDKGIWRFEKMILRVMKGDQLVSFTTKKEGTIDQKITVEDIFSTQQPSEFTTRELGKQIGIEKQAGRQTRPLEIEFHSRYALPFACLIMAIAGPGFAVRFGKSGGFIGILLAVMLMWAYYNLYVISTEILGKVQWCPAFVSAWLANVLFAILGIWGLRRLE